jgi:hypothetical protein
MDIWHSTIQAKQIFTILGMSKSSKADIGGMPCYYSSRTSERDALPRHGICTGIGPQENGRIGPVNKVGKEDIA